MAIKGTSTGGQHADPFYQLELVSRGRKGPEGPLFHFSPEQVQQIQRTVRRVPEVIVKVSGGGRDGGGVRAHLRYIDRHGKLPIRLDDGRECQGRQVADKLLDEWGLDLCRGAHKRDERGRPAGPKLVHNIVLSMPRRTPANAMLAAAQQFAREAFALQYRYAMVLHTDQNHPHVHLVVKAEHEFEPGRRLNIRKATLREWREQFAACLREQGVAANATSSPVRGAPRITKSDAIYRRMHDSLSAGSQDTSAPRGSTFMRQRVEAVAKELQIGGLIPERGRERLLRTREAVMQRWALAEQVLRQQGEEGLADEVKAFVGSLPRACTEKELIAAGLLAELAASRQEPATQAELRRGRE